MALPDLLQCNAWLGATGAAASAPDAATDSWSRRDGIVEPRRSMAPPLPPDERDWRDPRVGWGLLLPDDDRVAPADKARALDAPAALAQLVQSRNEAPVLRWSPDLNPGELRRYDRDGHDYPVQWANCRFGTDAGAIPRYLLMYGPLSALPWRLQFSLQADYFVGRLPLEGDGLERYLEALGADWADAPARRERTVIWSVSSAPNDITGLMRDRVAAPLDAAFAADSELAPHRSFIDGAQGPIVGSQLCEAIADGTPSLIVTTSHGKTSPLDDADELHRALGAPIDQNGAPLSAADFSGAAAPHGSIWYAQACCSAGSEAPSAFADVVGGGGIAHLVNGLAAAGAAVAPLPRRLLGAERPIRAFVGHVEPTFNWSLQAPWSSADLTYSLTKALYHSLFQRAPEPVGMALQHIRNAGSSLLNTYNMAFVDYNHGAPTAEERLLACRLMALDWQSIVLLGDPTVSTPSHA